MSREAAAKGRDMWARAAALPEEASGPLPAVSKGGEAGAATPVSWADELVLEASGGGGMSILFPDANSGYVVFGSLYVSDLDV